MKPIIFFRKLHKWLGLIIGLQILLWVAGGFVMSFFDIEKVRGEHNTSKQQPVLIGQAVNFDSSQLIGALNYSPESIVLKQWQNRLVWSVHTAEQVQIYDAQTGKLLSPFTEATTQAVAKQDFIGDGALIQSQLITEPLSEVRGRKLPLWQHQFDDEDSTRIYVSAETGEVVARRNDTWRLFDFFWMLHIMDYKDRENFNNPLLIFAALLALLMSISGIYMVLKLVLFKPKRVKANG